MKKQLIVIKKNRETITLENQDSGCSTCSTKGVCGVGVLSKLSNKTITQKNNGEKIGDVIEVEIDNQEFIKTSFMLYLLPIFALFFGVLIAEHITNNILYQSIIGMLFLFLSLYLLKFTKKIKSTKT